MSIHFCIILTNVKLLSFIYVSIIIPYLLTKTNGIVMVGIETLNKTVYQYFSKFTPEMK